MTKNNKGVQSDSFISYNRTDIKVGFLGLRSVRKRSLHRVNEHFSHKHNAKITL